MALFNLPLVSINNEYATMYHQIIDENGRVFRSFKSEEKKQKSFENLEDNTHPNEISRKSKAKLKRYVSTMLHLVTEIRKEEADRAITFATLTLSSTQKHDDIYIKKKMLNQLLIELKRDYKLDSYIWKAEKQENENLHFHILCDVRIPHKELRDKWNRIQEKEGYLDEYREKHNNLTFEEYANRFSRNYSKKSKIKTKSIEELKALYLDGKQSNWSNPNSTDIHSLYKSRDGKKISNIVSYIAKYMSKSKKEVEYTIQRELDQRFKREFDAMKGIFDETPKSNGRIWYCSTDISNCSKSAIEIDEKKVNDELNHLIDTLPKEQIIIGDSFLVICYRSLSKIKHIAPTLYQRYLDNIKNLYYKVKEEVQIEPYLEQTKMSYETLELNFLCNEN